jgi:signal transduction histidine kinase/DNA-binding response OmpR family regulator
MALRLRSLKTRTALALSSVIVAILVFNAVYLTFTKWAELRKGIEQDALTFTRLTRTPIGAAYLGLYRGDFYRFRDLMRDLLAMNPDVVKVQILDPAGKVLFDSDEIRDVGRPAPPSATRKPGTAAVERLAALRRSEDTVLHGRNADGEETLEIIAPYSEEGGPLFVDYQVSYRRLKSEIQHLVWATGGLTLISIVISLIVAVALATRITKPLSELTAGAKEIAEGHFDRRLDIRSNDELEILADSFNDMTGRLKHNVEALEESNKKLGAANEELKELDRMKSDLLANVSHELRTPLTAIKGYTDYILERKLGTITEKQEKGLVVVQRNLERLSKSINALLDFSRMDVGRIVLNIQPFPLPALVEQIQTTVRSELDKKGLTLATRIDPALPPVVADREKLSAVLENLVINAIKFTPEGGRILIAARRGTVAGGTRAVAEIEVTDTGIGIPPDQLGRIFNRFHQVESSTTRRFGGVGLGLAIVKSILEAHGASIQVDSVEGKGTAFRFQLPLAEKAEAAAPPARAPERAEEGLVLVVDDDPEVVRLVRGYLEDDGLAVLSASTAAEGASLAADRHPDVILLDLLLPDQSGLELLQVLKRDAATARIPVLVVSIMNDSVKGLTMGAADYLVKPVERGPMVAAVRRLLDGGAREPLVLVVDDEHDTAELIRDTLRTEGLRTQVAHHGRQALELIARKRPDLVILDIMMPEMSGFEVLEALARDQDTAGIPVLVLTARGDENDARRGLELGARRYMSKPFDVRALIAEVRRHLGPDAQEGQRRASL